MGRAKRTLAVILCVTFLFFVCFHASRSVLKTLYPLRYDEFVEAYALENEISKKLLYAVIKTESGFNELALSSADARGLTQITPDTFRWLQTKTGERLGLSELYKPQVSIKYGALFYCILMKRFGSVETAAAAYHAGIGSVTRWLKDSRFSADGKTLCKIPFPSTAQYVKRIVTAMTVYEKLYNI